MSVWPHRRPGVPSSSSSLDTGKGLGLGGAVVLAGSGACSSISAAEALPITSHGCQVVQSSIPIALLPTSCSAGTEMLWLSIANSLKEGMCSFARTPTWPKSAAELERSDACGVMLGHGQVIRSAHLKQTQMVIGVL